MALRAACGGGGLLYTCLFLDNKLRSVLCFPCCWCIGLARLADPRYLPGGETFSCSIHSIIPLRFASPSRGGLCFPDTLSGSGRAEVAVSILGRFFPPLFTLKRPTRMWNTRSSLQHQTQSHKRRLQRVAGRAGPGGAGGDDARGCKVTETSQVP